MGGIAVSCHRDSLRRRAVLVPGGHGMSLRRGRQRSGNRCRRDGGRGAREPGAADRCRRDRRGWYDGPHVPFAGHRPPHVAFALVTRCPAGWRVGAGRFAASYGAPSAGWSSSQPAGAPPVEVLPAGRSAAPSVAGIVVRVGMWASGNVLLRCQGVMFGVSRHCHRRVVQGGACRLSRPHRATCSSCRDLPSAGTVVTARLNAVALRIRFKWRGATTAARGPALPWIAGLLCAPALRRLGFRRTPARPAR